MKKDILYGRVKLEYHVPLERGDTWYYYRRERRYMMVDCFIKDEKIHISDHLKKMIIENPTFSMYDVDIYDPNGQKFPRFALNYPMTYGVDYYAGIKFLTEDEAILFKLMYLR